MGLRDELQADLAEAFNTDLADAVLSFTGEYMGPGVYDPVTEETTAQPVTYSGRGVLSRYEDRRIDNVNILVGDLRLTALVNEVSDVPDIGHTITAPDLTDRTKQAAYQVKTVRVDPASATYRVQLRKA
ncbi:glutamate 5-kinase [Pseudomonas chlororaphis]|uniref:glutamate 5-kinase n=1 Tax=Pseudomonas chlororaphis TaxID=587753 RepID=UPI0023668595|nr:glutamate 5-kinase [Pseudomonas chlororaphis]WDG52493.1 glutamate 5-kinase [Pseudomonas chlororaphis]WDH86490.1 glutamate 5-kinase [Pseudomonas chlororaphis]